MSFSVREITARGTGAVSVVSVHGASALAVVCELASGVDLPHGVPKLVRLRVGNEDLDEALVCVIGEDEVEIHVHGSPPLVRKLCLHLEVRAASAVQDMRPALATVEERALERLANAPCEAAARILLDQAEGALRRAVEVLIERPQNEREAAIDVLLENARVARFVFTPISAVLSGPVNAGKSTLFNVLVGEQRVVVSDEPGTTRDSIRENALFGEYPIVLADTAGERALHGTDALAQIERAGQARARQARAQADLVLWLTPLPAHATPAAFLADLQSRAAHGTAGDHAAERSVVPRVRVASLHTCADRIGASLRSRFENAISAQDAPEAARECVITLFHALYGLPRNPWRAGAPVPFDDGLVRRLAGLRGTRSVDDLRSEMRRILDGR